MHNPIADLSQLLSSMEPKLNPGIFVFTLVRDAADLKPDLIVASIREAEGLSVILPESEAVSRNLPILFRAAWITLTVTSDLQAVGLTAAFSSALSRAGISCNVVAGAYHDHVFVPIDRAEQALNELRALQAAAAAKSQA
jgi:uncharacterized protein